MTRIQDIGTFSAVREAGMAKLLPAAAAHRRRHGHLRHGQRRRGRLSCLRRGHRSAAAATCGWPRVGCFGFCAQEPLVNVRLPGKPLVILRRVQASDVRRILDDLAGRHRARRPGALQDRRVGPPHRAHPVRHGIPEDPALAATSRSSSRRRRSCCATAA